MKVVPLAGVALATLLVGAPAWSASYRLSEYAPVVAANPWTVSSDTPADEWIDGSVNLTVSNAVTGEVRQFSVASSARYGNAAVNDRGDVLVTTFQSDRFQPNMHLWSGGALQNLGGSWLSGTRPSLLSDGGVRAEFFLGSGGGYQSRLYANGVWNTVAAPSGPTFTFVAAVNASGTAVGLNNLKAAISQAPGQYALLSGVAGHSALGFTSSAGDINNQGLIVGTQHNNAGAPSYDGFRRTIYTEGTDLAVLWDANLVAQDLNALIDPSSALFGQVRLTGAYDIDDSGDILARGHSLANPSQTLHFRLSAVPEAGTLASMGLGLVAMGALTASRRRQEAAAAG